MVTLDRLVNVLGSYGVRLCNSAIPRSAVLRSVVLHEGDRRDRPVVGDVLLGVGAQWWPGRCGGPPQPARWSS